MPIEKCTGLKPDLAHPCIFGVRVFVRCPGTKPAKLGKHTYMGVFLGYTASNQNKRYINIMLGQVKMAYHIIFDEAHYDSYSQPQGPQFLFNIGYQVNQPESQNSITTILFAKYPPISAKQLDPVLMECYSPLLLGKFLEILNYPAVACASIWANKYDPSRLIFSRNPYTPSFTQPLELKGSDPTFGLVLSNNNHCYHPQSINICSSTPAAQIPRWYSCLKHAYLLCINDKLIHSCDQAVLLCNIPKLCLDTETALIVCFEEL